MTEQEIKDLKEKTQQTDRLSEKIEDEEEEEEREYTSIDDLVLRKNKNEDVNGLKEQTRRDNRVTEKKEEKIVELSKADEIIDGSNDIINDPYCGNCEHIEFKKENGEPVPTCALHEMKTELKSGYICNEYDAQVNSGE